MSEETKRCTACSEVKPLSEFYGYVYKGHKRTHSRCKPCYKYRQIMAKEGK